MSNATPETEVISEALEGLLALLGRRMFRAVEAEGAVVAFLKLIASKDDILSLLPLLTALDSKLDQIQAQLNSRLDHLYVQINDRFDVIDKQEKLMATNQANLNDDMLDIIQRFDTATNDAAARWESLQQQVMAALNNPNALTADQRANLDQRFAAEIAKLQAIGADPTNPIPTGGGTDTTTGEPAAPNPGGVPA